MSQRCNRKHYGLENYHQVSMYCTKSECKIKLMCTHCVRDFHLHHDYVSFSKLRQELEDLYDSDEISDDVFNDIHEFEQTIIVLKDQINRQIYKISHQLADSIEKLKIKQQLLRVITKGQYHEIQEKDVKLLGDLKDFTQQLLSSKQQLQHLVEQLTNISNNFPTDFTKLIYEFYSDQKRVEFIKNNITFNFDEWPTNDYIFQKYKNTIYFGQFQDYNYHGKGIFIDTETTCIGEWIKGQQVWGCKCSKDKYQFQYELWEGLWNQAKWLRETYIRELKLQRGFREWYQTWSWSSDN